MNINKKYIVDEHGDPKEVILPLEDFRKIEELLGLDLNEKELSQLREARLHRESGDKSAYVDLDSI